MDSGENGFSCSGSAFGSGEYVSPNFACVLVDKCFPDKIEGDFNNITNPLFRKQYKHTWFVDKNFIECGFLSRDEVHILYNAALKFKNKKALEIGSHTGWSTVHIALAGVHLDVVEPQLHHDPRVLLSIIQSLRLSNTTRNVNLSPGFSPEAVHKLASSQKKWSFFFIDGNHNGDYPLNDAKVCYQYAEPEAMIFFHDLAFPDVARGFLYFKGLEDWKTKVYHTQQIVGVAWRGSIEPPEHTPDPRYQWDLPSFLSPFYDENGNEK